MSHSFLRQLNQRWFWLSVTCAFAFAMGLFGWRAFSPSPRPNVIFITLDTFRADHIGCYGYPQALTPALDALAAEGILFERAYATAPLTLPSHASMITGLYPPEHGLLINGSGRLDEGIPTVAEIFRDAGYDTAAFIASFVLDSKFGLERGFGKYDDDMVNTDPAHDGLHRQRDGAEVVDAALAWLRRDRDTPFFCWVHLYDAHAPYPSDIVEFGDRFRECPYDGGIAYVDLQVQRLVKYLRRNQLSDKTLIVVVGDHGEGLGEHNETLHGLTLYNAVTHVPWILAGHLPGTKGRRVSQPVSLVDLSPTLLDYAGLRKLDKVSGQSLRPALDGGKFSTAGCFSVTDFPLLEFGWSPSQSLTTERWKYIRSAEVELYDLDFDPRELNNLASTFAEQTRLLEDELATMEQNMVPRNKTVVELTSQEQRKLASLGYLGGQSVGQKQNALIQTLPDVKQMLPLYNRAEAANRMQIEGDAATGELRLRELIQQAPDFLPAYVYLAAALTQQQKLEESREISESALRKDPHHGGVHFQLGCVFIEQKKFAEAIEEFQKSLTGNPFSAAPIFCMSQAFEGLGQISDAENALRKVLQQDPLYPNAHAAMGRLLANQKRDVEAESFYREELKYTANSAEAHDGLATLLARQNLLVEAKAHAKQAVALAPKHPAMHFNYATLLMRLRNSDEAVSEFEATLRINPHHVDAMTGLQQARKQTQPR